MSSRLRQRLYPTLPRSPLDGWCARGLMVLALSGGLASGLWLVQRASLPLWLAILLPTCLLLGPQLSRLPFRGSLLPQNHRLFHHLLILLMAFTLAWFQWHAGFGAWTVFLLLAVHGFALRNSRPDTLAAVALLLPILEIQFAHSVLWPMGLLARTLMATWMLITFFMTIALATWLHARWTRRLLQIDRDQFENCAETELGLWGRARLMLLLGLVLLPLGLASQQLALLVTIQPAEARASALAAAEASSLRSAQAAQAKHNAANENQVVPQELQREMVLPSTIAWQGKVIETNKKALVFRLISDRDRDRQAGEPPYFSANRPLYLLATTFDRLDHLGLSRGPSSEVIRHSDDGVGADDWIIFDEDLINHPVSRFEIRQRLLFNDADGVKGTRGYLLHDRRLVALHLPSCRLDEDGTALGTLTSGELMAYQWWSQPVLQNVALLPNQQAEYRYLALPQETEFQDWILQARALCSEDRSAEEKLARIVAYFQREFSYDLEPSQANGMAAFADFFANQRGYCSYFAAAGMLFLRANGIACRVASGFLVSEFSTSENAYVGRLADAHAWLEVQQQDGSWRTVDPTPSSSRNVLMVALRAQAAALASLKKQPDNTDTESTSEENFALPAPVGKTLVGLNWVLMTLFVVLPFILCALVLASVWARLRKLGKRRHMQATFSEEANHAMDYWGRIEWLLEELGFHSQPTQSILEYTQQVRRWGGEFFAPLNTVTTLVYRSRFGNYAWSQRQQQYLEQFEQLLESKVRKDN
jgi:transglutaminase-like putative cysteine protease